MSAEDDKKDGLLQHLALDQIMSDRFGRYSKYIIQNRALPDARDGLKPVQRRILYAMDQLGLTSASPFKKSARVVGEVIGKFHPHGDSSIYEAMVRMAQEWKSNVPLIDMHGNKGSIDDDPAAAMRYTEARLAPVAGELLRNLDKASVAFAPNFDDSEIEPVVLPALFPNLLVNGAKGIAAGYATEMPPHNAEEIIDAIILKIKSPAARLSSLLNVVKGPDFPTGGVVQGLEGIAKAFETGQGRILIKSHYEVVKSKNQHQIIITEIPFGVVKQKLVRDIDAIILDKKVPGIKEIRDESDRQGISIVIDLLPTADSTLIINYLLQRTEMQIYYHYNNIAISNNAPKQLGLSALIDEYLAHQKDVQRKALSFDLAKAKARLEIVEGFIRVSEIPNEVIAVIRAVEGSRKEVVAALQAAFQFTENQAGAIADLRLYRLSKADYATYQAEAATLRARIAELTTLLTNPESFDKYLIDLLRALRKAFATPRRTRIEAEITKVEIDKEALIPDDEVQLSVSRGGYLRKVASRTKLPLEECPLKQDDLLLFYGVVSSKDKLVVFTSEGRALVQTVHFLAESKPKDVGLFINELMPLAEKETLVEAVVVSDFNVNATLILATSRGKIKRSALGELEGSKPSRVITVIKLADDEALVAAKISSNFMHLALFASNGKMIRYPETTVPMLGLKAQGVIGFNFKHPVMLASFVAGNFSDEIILLSARGEAKALTMNSVPEGARTSQGKIALMVKNNALLEAGLRNDSTKLAVLGKDHELHFKDATDINISSVESGFKTLQTNVSNAKIINNIFINSAWISANTPSKNADNDRFSKAEAKIAEVSQISIDDILKKIK